MRVKYLLWGVISLFVIFLLWLNVFFFVSILYPKNWQGFKMFSENVIKNPRLLVVFFRLKTGLYPVPEQNIISDAIKPEDFHFHPNEEVIWDVNRSYVVAKVLGVNLSEKIFSVVIIRPGDKSFSNIKKNVKVECVSGDTRVALRENQIVLDQKIDLFSNVAVDDLVYSYCSDENCDTFIKACALVKMNGE